MKIKLITDSACDLPLSFVQENNIDIASLTVNINGEFKKINETQIFSSTANLARSYGTQG